jgi:hypothetical protein
MTVNEIATRGLSYFPPEMRGIPDASAYPGPNAAVLNAINAALQEVAQLGAPWFGFDERQVHINPAATVEVALTQNSATGIISAAEWEAYMEGCAAIIPGAIAPNRIRKATATLTESVILITGNLSSVDPLTVPPLLLETGLTNGRRAWSAGTWRLWWNTGITPEQWTLDDSDSGGLWTSQTDTEDPTEAEDWLAFFPSDGAPVIAFGTEWTIDLTGTHQGESGILPVTIYHDAVHIGDDVLKLHHEAYLSGEPIHPIGDIRQARPRRSPSQDYRMAGSSGDTAGRFTLPTGRPTHFSAEAWRTGATVAHRRLLRLAPAPTAQHTLDLRVSVTPPEITSLTSTALLPIPFQFIESTFLPIMLFHLQDCPWFQPPAGDMASKYAAARESIKAGNPAGNAAPRLTFKG